MNHLNSHFPIQNEENTLSSTSSLSTLPTSYSTERHASLRWAQDKSANSEFMQ